MNTGDIIFVHGKSIIDRTIEFFDEGPFNHVCMAMPYGRIVETQYPVNTRSIKNPYSAKEVVVVNLGLTDEERQKLAESYFKYLPYKYDVWQIFGILFHDVFGLNTNKTWNSKNKLICSELVVDLLHDIGYFKKHAYFGDTRNLTPNELYRVLVRLKNKQPIAR